MRFGFASADDDQVPVDDAWCCERYRERAEVGLQSIDDKAFAQIDAAILPEAWDELSGFRIEAEQKIHHAGVDAAVAAVVPVRDTTDGLTGNDTGVELPLQLSRHGIERDNFAAGSGCVKRAANDERIGLDATLFAGVVGPGTLEQVHVVAIDLR